MQKTGLTQTLQILLLFILGFTALYFAKPFLVPFCIAGLLAMLFLPFCQKLEDSGFNRAMATLVCVLVLLMIIAGIIALVYWQVNNLVSDLGNIENKIKSAWKHISSYITETFGISRKEQEEMIEGQSSESQGGMASMGISLVNVFVNFILTVVYIFLLLFYRTRIKKFISQLIPRKEGANTNDAIDDIKKIAQKYLTGLGIMIVCLWIMYSIGFTILGLKHAIFFAILCGLFEIVPFIGNLAGNTLAVLMAITQGGGMSMVIGIIITYAVIQFLQTYLLEPLVVGNEVNINPLFTIIGLVVGELVWGIPGLVLAIPLMGILKIICDHVDALKPYGYLMGRDRNKNSLVDKIKERFARK